MPRRPSPRRRRARRNARDRQAAMAGHRTCSRCSTTNPWHRTDCWHCRTPLR